MAKVEIRSNGVEGHVFVDGKEVPDVRGYSISHYAGGLPVFKLEIVTTDLVLDGSGFLPQLPDVYKPFYKSIDPTP